jgi:hypothetical protein
MASETQAGDLAPRLQTAPLYCRRCGHLPTSRPLGVLGPGYFHLRDRRRSVLAIGGVVIVRCERCGAHHRLDLVVDTTETTVVE